MFLTDLFEARRNPEKNPFVSIIDALRPFKDDPSVFISFTDDVGHESHATSSSKDADVRIARRANPGRNVSGPKIGINPQTGFTSTPVGVYVYPLKEIWPDLVNRTIRFGQDRPYVYVLRSRVPVLELHRYTDQDLESDIAKLTPLIVKARGERGFPPSSYVRMWKNNAPIKTPGGKFWNVVHSLAELEAKHRGTENIVGIWNGLLRSLGYRCIADRKGDMIIHGAEPCQAVFLDRSAFQVVDLVHNVRKGAQGNLPGILDSINTPDSASESILNEVDWHDRSPLTQVLQQNKGRWIHFTKGLPIHPTARARTPAGQMPKLGFNPKPYHKDPIGIYFYPTDWLLSDVERIKSGNQYGTDWPYYYLADVDTSMPGFKLSQVTWGDVEKLAARNGWKNLLDEYRTDKANGHEWQLPSYTNHNHPGSFLWHFVDTMQKDGKITWAKALKGLAWIIDDDQSIIHSNEPSQLIVLDPRALKNVEMGENTPTGYRNANSDNKMEKTAAWKHAFRTIFEKVQQKYGGKIVWTENKDARPYDRNKPKAKNRGPAYPGLDIQIEDRRFKFRVKDDWSLFGIAMQYWNGREEGYDTIKSEVLRDENVEQIVARINAFIEKVLSLGSDLRFEPSLSEEELQSITTDLIAPRFSGEIKFETEINNTEGREQIWVSGAGEHVVDGLKLNLYTTARTGKKGTKDTDGSVTIKINDRGITEASSYEGFDNPDQLMDALAEQFEERLRRRSYDMAPKENDRYYSRRFYSQDDFDCFLGWLILASGISLGGRLEKRFEAEIAKYHAMDEQARKNFPNEIKYVMGGY